jgi:hypothetical protein
MEYDKVNRANVGKGKRRLGEVETIPKDNNQGIYMNK